MALGFREKPKTKGCLKIVYFVFVVIHIIDYSLIPVKAFSKSVVKTRKMEGGEILVMDNVSILCNQRGITIAKLERDVGLGNATIRGWKNSRPRIDTLQKVADYFGVSVDDLLQKEMKQ